MEGAQKHSRFQQLRQRQQEGVLTEAERAELQFLIQELEAADASFLTLATERLRQEWKTLEDQNRTLDGLLSRKVALVSRLGAFLAEAQAERRAIECELSEALAGSQPSSMDR